MEVEKNNTPLLSIIIPTFNSAATLPNCLSSVLGQAYHEIEILVQDGGSTDATLAIVQATAEQAPGVIRLISEKDLGIYDAMNRALARASGDWLYFLGSDDYLHDTQVLADVAAVLADTPADIVYGDAIVASNGSRQGGEFDLHRLMTYNNLCHQTVFYRREVFKVMGSYNLAYPIIADWDFNIRCFQNSVIRTRYIQRDIVLFNDVTGISSTSQNDPFYQLVPAFYIRRLAVVEREKQDILHSAEFRIGRKIYTFLKQTGILSLLKKLR